MRPSAITRNILGAFSDGAVLFPLVALLSSKAGVSGGMALFGAGVAYLASAFLFRVPMSVQPLKSIAVAAITVGASFQEVRVSGALLGIFCIGLCFFNVDRLAKRVPATVIHQLQVGLGVLLVFQGAKAFGDWTMLVGSFAGVCVLGAIAFMVLFPEVGGLPVLGLVATFGLVAAVFNADSSQSVERSLGDGALIRPYLVAGLLVPQMALTLANSVLSTRDVCSRYFGAGASRVSIRRLLYSIGLGNVLVALIGGMPFCHGSGGVTAHVKGGSTQPWSTGLMGVFLLAASAIQFRSHSQVLTYPPFLVAILLITTGIFHLKLAAPTAANMPGRIKLAAALLITIFTRNLLWVLGVAILLELSESLFAEPAYSRSRSGSEVKL